MTQRAQISHRHKASHHGEQKPHAKAAKAETPAPPRPHHNPFDEAAQPFAIANYVPKDSGTSWAVLDVNGNLVESMSHNPHQQQDPASTTKLMTLYTVLTKIKNGQLPADFLEQHRTLINRMLVQSDNHAAQSIAQLADSQRSVSHFCAEMTQLAQQVGLQNSRFASPEGYPGVGTYSTAADMARLPFLLQRDFPQQVQLAAQINAPGVERINTGAQLLSHGVLFGKTGTGDSADNQFGGYGGKGKFSYSGAGKNGYVAVAAASSRDERNGIVLGAVIELANRKTPAPPALSGWPIVHFTPDYCKAPYLSSLLGCGWERALPKIEAWPHIPEYTGPFTHGLPSMVTLPRNLQKTP